MIAGKVLQILVYFNLTILFCAHSFAEEIKFATNDWCPFVCNFAQTGKNGIMVDILKEIFETEGKKISFEQMAFLREILEVRANNYQAIVGIIPEVAPDFIFPREPIYSTQFCFFTLPESAWKFSSFKNTYPKITVGFVSGKALDPLFAKAFPAQLPIHGEDELILRLINLLQKKRIDTFLEEKTVVKYIFKKNGIPPLRIAGCIDKKNEYIAFSPKNPRSKKYAELFSDRIVKLRKSPKYMQIINRYQD